MSDTNDKRQHLGSDSIENLAHILKNSKGKLSISIKDNPTLSISLEGNNILLDVHDASIFGGIASDKDDVGLLDKLKTARQFAEILNNNGLSLSVLRKGKKAITIGRDATPTVSSIITGSDDIQIDSVTQVAKLGKDTKTKKKLKNIDD